MSVVSRKLWIISSNRWNSAITEYALRSSQALMGEDWSVVFSPLTASPAAKRAHALEIPTVSFESFGLSSLLKFRAVYRTIRPSTVLFFGGPETFLGRFIGDKARMVRFRGQDGDGDPSGKSWISDLSLSHCRGVLTPSLLVAQAYKMRLPKKQVASVTLGLDTSQFYSNPAIYSKSLRPKLLMVGRLDPIKGHQRFFRFFKIVLETWPRTLPKPILEVIGQPANISEESLRLMAEDAGLIANEDWMLDTRRVNDLCGRMHEAHLGVVPSLGSEIICRGAEEFLLSGCMLAVSKVGSLPEVLAKQIFGEAFDFSPQEEEVVRFQKTLIRAFEEGPEQRYERADQAKNFFSLRAMGIQLTKFLDSL